MYHTTGFSRDAIIDLCAMVSATEPEPGINHWPPILGLFKCVHSGVRCGRGPVSGELLAVTRNRASVGCRSTVSGGLLAIARQLPAGWRA